MRFLVDECLHTSLVDVAQERGHEGHHVNWLGLGGASDRELMRRIIADDLTFVTNNARDFRKLYARQALHAGLVIIVPQVSPAVQRGLFDALLDEIVKGEELVNSAIEIRIEEGASVVEIYALPDLGGQ